MQNGQVALERAFRMYANDEALSREGAQSAFFEPPSRGEAFEAAFGEGERRAAEEPAPGREAAAADRLRDLYEGNDEQFRAHGKFFSKVLREPSRSRITDYGSVAEMYADADARFHARRGDRAGVVWLNRPAAEVVREALGDDVRFSGARLAADDAPVVETLRRQLNRLGPGEGAARLGLQKLADALNTAFRRDGDAVVVVGREMQGPRRLDAASRSLRHEIWHRAMDGMEIDSARFSNDPLVERGLKHLGSHGYPAGQTPSWREVPAYIAAGQWQRLGYSLDEAARAFVNYLDRIADKHGAEGVDRRSNGPAIKSGATFVETTMLPPDEPTFPNPFEGDNLREQRRLAKAYREGGLPALKRELAALENRRTRPLRHRRRAAIPSRRRARQRQAAGRAAHGAIQIRPGGQTKQAETR